jgi:energy-coupling factor transporter ATP-binding protein EcfA2
MPCSSHIKPNAPPSRSTNPFATCWINPGAIPFHFPNNDSAESLIAKLSAQGWRGAILGPHGSGKSTLLESLKPALRAAGRTVRAITLHDGQRRLPHGFTHSLRDDDDSIAIIDGYEQLAWPARLNIWLRARATNSGLLVTSHTPVRIPTLVRLTPTRALVEGLVAGLCTNVSTIITRADVAASHAGHGSNVREIFFDLYDLFESRRRAANLSPATT